MEDRPSEHRTQSPRLPAPATSSQPSLSGSENCPASSGHRVNSLTSRRTPRHRAVGVRDLGKSFPQRQQGRRKQRHQGCPPHPQEAQLPRSLPPRAIPASFLHSQARQAAAQSRATHWCLPPRCSPCEAQAGDRRHFSELPSQLPDQLPQLHKTASATPTPASVQGSPCVHVRLSVHLVSNKESPVPSPRRAGGQEEAPP